MPFKVGLQLYTVREDLTCDFLDGLGRVADIGYRYVEFAGFGDTTAIKVGERLLEIGVEAIGAHVPLSVLSDPGSVVEDLQAIDCRSATLPWVPEAMRQDWTETSKHLDEAALTLAERGIEFSYHNHDFEFANFGYKTLVSTTKHTRYQLDVYWAEKAGESAVEWIQRLRNRMSSLHCKDLAADGADIEIGSGTLDWQSIVNAAREAGVDSLVIEMDTPRMRPMESAEACLRGLKRFL